MEEEYRMQKAQTEISQVIATNGDAENEGGNAGRMVIHEDGSVVTSVKISDARTADDNASTRAMASPTIKTSSGSEINGTSLDASSTIPTIRVSTESERDREEGSKDFTSPAHEEVEPNMVSETLEKPMQAAAGEGEQGNGESSPLPVHEPFSFSNKRLCERWLDNLFMVLYEVSHMQLVAYQRP
jgi:hypothetical protein